MAAINSRMLSFHKLVSLLLVAVLLALAVPTALAGTVATSNNLIATCTNGTLDVSWMVNAISGTGTISLTVNSTPVDNRTITNTPVYTGTYNTAATGTVTVALIVNDGYNLPALIRVVECGPAAPQDAPASLFACQFADKRINAYECAPPAIPYCMPWGIDVYVMNPETGAGERLMGVRDEILEAIGVPDENTKLAQVDDIILSRLSTGEFQLNALDGEGNTYVLVWDDCPPNTVYNIINAE